MDTMCVYRNKLHEALTLVPSMSQDKRIEAVGYWNHAATQFQKLVNANAPLRDEPQASPSATGLNCQNSSLTYQQQVSDSDPTVIVNTEAFGHGLSNRLDQSDPQDCILIDTDINPPDTANDQYHRQAPLVEQTLYDTDYYQANMVGGLQPQQLQLSSPSVAEMNTIATMCNPTASQESLLTMSSCPADQQYISNLQPTEPVTMDSIVPQVTSISTIDNRSTEDTQVPDESTMFCPILDGSMQAVPLNSAPVGNPNLGQAGTQAQQAQIGHVVDMHEARPDMTQFPRQTTAVHDIGNGQFDRGPGGSAREGSMVGLPDTNLGFSIDMGVMNNHRDESYTHGARPLQQIQVFGQPFGDCDYGADERLRSAVPQERQPATYMLDSNLSVTPHCSTSNIEDNSQQIDSVVKQEANDAAVGAKLINEQHTCELCGKSGFSTKGNLKRHRKAHAGEKPYKCEHCDSKFTEKKSLKIHLRRHTGEKPYKCTICEKPFSQTGVLKSHMALHLEERKFNCDKCSKAFRQRSQLKLHLMRHDGIKKLECSRCMAKFLTKGDLERHFRIHTGERPYKCNLCDKTFTRQQSLNEHKNRHIGRKPFSCKLCDKSFSEMSASYKHAKVHKKEEQALQQRNR